MDKNIEDHRFFEKWGLFNYEAIKTPLKNKR